VHEATSFVREDDEHEEESTRGRRYDEEVGHGDLGNLIREKRPPRLRRRSSMPERRLWLDDHDNPAIRPHVRHLRIETTEPRYAVRMGLANSAPSTT